MREIKFRAWNAELEKMYKLAKVDYLGSHGILDHYIGCYDAIWMEYIGLKDRNGKEIFEGDILRLDGTSEYEHCIPAPTPGSMVGIYQVVSELSGWGNQFSWNCISGYECSTHIMGEADENGIMPQVEIIGNIYQNPELLQSQAELTPTNSTVNLE